MEERSNFRSEQKRRKEKQPRVKRRNKRTHPYAAVLELGVAAQVHGAVARDGGLAGSEQSARGRLRYVLVLVAEI